MLLQTDLFDFIGGLDVKEKKVDTLLDTKICDKEEKEEDVWQDIATQRIPKVIVLHRKTFEKQSKNC